jgi:hypothetical protein
MHGKCVEREPPQPTEAESFFSDLWRQIRDLPCLILGHVPT